jgi:glycyl-tRNA synthetase beta chain
LADLAEQAARLCKADLVTEMVGEFPELQGLMGGYYAAKQGLDPQVAAAIRDHYKPVGQGDDVPTDPVTVAVSLADKLDSLLSFLLIKLMPTGSKDPFALRRAAIATISIMFGNCLRISLGAVVRFWIEVIEQQTLHTLTAETSALELQNEAREALLERARKAVEANNLPLAEALLERFPDWKDDPFVEAVIASLIERDNGDFDFDRLLIDFFADRLKVQQREAGVRHDLIDAVFALGGEDDLVRLLARVKALQGFVETGEGTNLLAGYKRAANILKKEGRGDASAPVHTPETGGGIAQTGEEDPLALVEDPGVAAAVTEMAQPGSGLGYDPEPAEIALIGALDKAEPLAALAIDAEDFEGAMAALAALRAPIDAFFESVTVNDADQAKREARLNLLARFRAAVHRVADFSKIEG